jgi:hypothetical protein
MSMHAERRIRYHNAGWFAGTPKMQMYAAMPRDEVVAIIACAGADILSVERGEHGDVENTDYLARRAPR